MNRRGFLSLLGAGVVGAVASRVVPSSPVRIVAATGPSSSVARYFIGFTPELDGFQEIVEPGGLVRLIALVQRPFRPERLIFSSRECVEKLEIEGIGDDAIGRPLPAELFTELAPGVSLNFGIAAPGDQLVLALRNTSREEVEVSRVALIGSGIL